MKEKQTLKEVRIRQNLTQEELANAAGISIRTIQRIEKGETTGSSYTIKTLAKTLGIESNNLKISEPTQNSQKEDIYIKVKLQNFSILSVILIPFGNLVFPALIFFRHREDPKIKVLGKKILSFQMMSTILLFIVTLIVFLSIGRGSGAIPIPALICYPMYVLTSVSTVIYTSVHMHKNNKLLNLFPTII